MTTTTITDLAELIDRLNLDDGTPGVGYDVATVERIAAGFDPATTAAACRFIDAVTASAHAQGYRKGYIDGRYDGEHS